MAGLPDGEDMVRVWLQRDPAALRARLGEAPLVAWAEDDVLHVLWQGTADQVTLTAGVQPQLWPVEGAGDLWEASLRIRHLDEAVISLVAVPGRALTSPGSSRSGSPAAPARPASATTWPPGRSRPGSGRPPGNGRSACSAPAPLPLPGVDRRPRPLLVGAAAARRPGLAAGTAMSTGPAPW